MSVRGAFKKLFRPVGLLALDAGFDFRRLTALRHMPRYMVDVRKFRSLGGTVTHRYPVLSDFSDQAGTTRGHYFHQDLLVAGFVYSRNPTRHIDVGSRIDGFVAHLATFRRVEVMDVRKLDDTGHPNISFIQADLMDRASAPDQITDSLSSLHAIEHFGLGRYGDPLHPSGHIEGFNNMARMLKPGGQLYISFPIGRSNEVHFNGHRIFHPRDVLNWARKENELKLERFDYVDDAGALHRNVDLRNADLQVTSGCGIYTFSKTR
jgi:SAM-dependent methyltransferase